MHIDIANTCVYVYEYMHVYVCMLVRMAVCSAPSEAGCGKPGTSDDAQFPLLRSELRFATVCYGSSAT